MRPNVSIMFASLDKKNIKTSSLLLHCQKKQGALAGHKHHPAST
jgi:hypothetical protein